MKMINTPKRLDEIVAHLRSRKGDYTDIEVKSGAGGLPDSLDSTLCAFANRPGGGTIIIGLDESQRFRPVDLDQPHQMAQQIVNKARSRFHPPIVVNIDADATVDGKPW